MGLDLLPFEVFTPYLVFVTQFPTVQCKVLPYGQDSAILVKVLEKIILGVAKGTGGIRSCFHWQEQSISTTIRDVLASSKILQMMTRIPILILLSSLH